MNIMLCLVSVKKLSLHKTKTQLLRVALLHQKPIYEKTS